MKYYVTRIPAILSLVLLTSCAGLKINRGSYNEAAVGKIKSAAIVGFEMVEPEPFDPLKPRGGDETHNGMASFNAPIAIPLEEKTPFYKNMRDFLKAQLKWNIPDMPVVTQNALNKELVKTTSTGIQMKSPIGQGEVRYSIPNLMDYDAVEQIGQGGREKLMDTFKVDALVSYRVRVQLSGTTVMGVGNMYPQAVLQMRVYQRGTEKAVWEDLQAEGKVADVSVGKTRITLDHSKINSLSVASAKTAYPVLLEQREKIKL